LLLLLFLRGVACGDGFGDGSGSFWSSSKSSNLEDADLFEIASNSAIKAASSSMLGGVALVRAPFVRFVRCCIWYDRCP
jgi:hypothetical protein